jgi:DnaJ domain
MPTLDETLGIPNTAKPEQIKRAYRILVKRFHPDLFPTGSATQHAGLFGLHLLSRKSHRSQEVRHPKFGGANPRFCVFSGAQHAPLRIHNDTTMRPRANTVYKPAVQQRRFFSSPTPPAFFNSLQLISEDLRWRTQTDRGRSGSMRLIEIHRQLKGVA